MSYEYQIISKKCLTTNQKSSLVNKMKKIKLSEEDRKHVIVSIKKIVGQLQSIASLVEDNKVTDQTFTQLLAVKGGTSKICKEIIAKGVMPNIGAYTKEELNQALNVIFKLD